MAADPGDERHPLAPLFDPRAVAIVGASENPKKRGHQILLALGESGYRGDVFPVHPTVGTILGRRVFPNLAAIPDAVDLAVLCTPAESVPALVRECGEAGIPGAVVLAVGFAESGERGRALQDDLAAAARETGVRVIGPNTSGVLNLHSGANLIGAREVRPGGLALLAQSGNIALALMREATLRSWEGVSICAGLGNGVDVGFDEAVDFLAEHDDTRAIVVHAEGFSRAGALLAAVDRASRRKPVVVVLGARSERGARSALSHTGTVAGPFGGLLAGLEQAGATVVDRTDEVLHVAEALGSQPPLAAGTGIAILSDGGGQSTLAMDALTRLGAPVAELSPETADRLRALLGPAASVANPVDLAGAADADPGVFATALEALSEDAAVGTVLLVGLFGGYGIRFSEELSRAELDAANRMADLMRTAEKGLVVHSMFAATRSAPLEGLGRARVPVIESLDVACRVVTEIARAGARRDRPSWEPVGHEVPVSSATGRPLAEPEARSLLGAAGLVFDETAVVSSAAEALEAAERMGGPVAVKVASVALLHRSGEGGVELDVPSAEVGAAFERVVAAAARHGAGGEPVRALVSPMAPPPIAELLVGATREAGLGVVLTVGAGGVLVEAVGDVAHRVLPLRPGDVEPMLEGLRIHPLLAGGRGRPAVAIEPIASAVRAIAAVVGGRSDVLEAEINPLFVYADRAVPIDARVIVASDSPL